MRIASAAPAADLLTGSAPTDDPAAASAFAAELDAATPAADATTAPQPGAAVDAESPAMTLDPATAATILASPIVHPLPAAAPAVGGEEGATPVAADGAPAAAAAVPVPSIDQPSQTGDLPRDTPLDAPTEDGASPVRDSATVLAVATTAADDATATSDTDPDPAPDTDADAETEDADATPTSAAAPQTPATIATPAGIVAASTATATATATADRPAAEPQPSARPATASVSSVDAAAPPAAVAASPAPAESGPVATDAAPAPTNVAPLAAPAVATAPAPVAAPAPAAPVNAAPLVDQVRVPIAALRELPDGAHVVTVHVTPDELGPVTVRALVHGGALDVQLTAPTDAAREALKALLPDLRRDLSQGGQPALLSLGDATADGAPARERETTRDALPGRGSDAGSETPAPRPAAPVRAGLATLDVLA